MNHVIAQTNNGITVYVNLIHSQAATQIARQPYLLGLLKELIAGSTLSGSRLRFERDMGREVGHEYVIETSDTDMVVYAQRLRENTFTRFVKNGKPTPTQYLTVVLRRDEAGAYELEDTWLGRACPPRPDSGDATSESTAYWANHAYVLLGGEPVQPRSLTKTCPY